MLATAGTALLWTAAFAIAEACARLIGGANLMVEWLRHKDGSGAAGAKPGIAQVVAWLSAVGAPWTLVYRNGTKTLDFILFSAVDDEALLPITRYTGLLQWQLPGSGPVDDAWHRLERWALDGGDDGRWHLKWLFSGQPCLKTPFAWTLLLGGNGSGKTQMAKELGRHLGRRRVFGDSEAKNGWRHRVRQRVAAFACWRQRVTPWRRSPDVPWDAGTVLVDAREGSRSAARLDALADWQPRAPSLLILDDPRPGDIKLVIDLLAKRSPRFWFPVRLLVIDQFMPPDAPVQPHSEGGWHHSGNAGHRFEPVLIENAAFGVAELRAVRSGYCWHRHDGAGLQPLACSKISGLWGDDAHLRDVAALVDGNPLLVALAVLWLAKDGSRSLDWLKSTSALALEEEALFDGGDASLKSLVAHRLVSDRIEDLVQDLAPFDAVVTGGQRGLREAVACAAIAAGLPLPAARAHFTLPGPESLRRLFPQEPAVTVRRLPPLKPWLMAESLFHKVQVHVHGADAEAGSAALIRLALTLHPDGALGCLDRSGPLAARVSAALIGLPPPGERADRLARYIAFARRALFVDRWFAAHALDAADHLDDRDVFEAMRQQDLLSRSRAPELPWALPQALLYCTLACRLLEQEPGNDEARETIAERLGAMGRTLDDWASPAAYELRALLWERFVDVVKAWLQAAVTSGPQTGLLARFDAINESVVRHWPGPLRRRFSEADMSWLPHAEGLAVCCVHLWRARGLAVALDESGTSATAAQLAELLATVECAESERALVKARASTFVAYACRTPESRHLAEAAARTVDDIARPFGDNADIQLERAAAWAHVAQARSDTPDSPDLTEAAARIIDDIARRFAANATVQGERAIAWQYVAEACSRTPGAGHLAEAAALTVDDIARPFADNASLQLPRAAAWQHVAYARTGVPASRQLTEAAAHTVDDIGRAFPDDASIQLQRAAAWQCVTHARSETPELRHLTEAAAVMVDDISRPFADNATIQLQRASAWRHVAGSRSETLESRDLTEAAAHTVDAVARPFEDNEAIQLQRANAWAYVAYARGQTPESRHLAEAAALTVDDISRRFADNPSIQDQRAAAWRHVAFARGQTPEVRHLTEAAAHAVEDIARPFADNASIQCSRAAAWRHVAYARSQTPESRHLAEAAARAVDNIAGPFAEDPSIQLQRAAGWRCVTYARSQTPESRDLTEAAARIVGEIAARFPDDERIERERELAWSFVPKRRVVTPDTAPPGAP